MTVGPIRLRRINPLFHEVVNTTLGIRKSPGNINGGGDQYEIVSLLDLHLVIIPELGSMAEAKFEVRRLVFQSIEQSVKELTEED